MPMEINLNMHTNINGTSHDFDASNAESQSLKTALEDVIEFYKCSYMIEKCYCMDSHKITLRECM